MMLATKMNTTLRSIAAALTAITLLASASAAESVVIRADSVHTGDGVVFEPGVVVVTDGLIAAVGGADLATPAGAQEVEADGGLTPGLIDADARVERLDAFDRYRQNQGGVLGRIIRAQHDPLMYACSCTVHDTCAMAHMHLTYAEDAKTCPLCAYPHATPGEFTAASGLITQRTLTESSSEVVCHTRVLDSLNLLGADFDRLAAGGVTTVCANPDSTAVIGPRSAIVRTAGPLAGRVMESEGAVHATTSSDSFAAGPSNSTPFNGFITTRTRRPTTRAGAVWVFRKAMNDADRYSRGLPIVGSDQAPEPALAVLSEVRNGRAPMRIHARAHHDIATALRLSDEFGIENPVILEAIEADRIVGNLKKAGASVVYGPIEFRGPNVGGGSGGFGGGAEPVEGRFGAFSELLAAGVPTALSAKGLRDENGLARQAMYAVRSGVDENDALAAVTSVPAEMLGIDGELGTIAVGKRADLVLWSGWPLAAGSEPAVVWMDGKIVSDRRDMTAGAR